MDHLELATEPTKILFFRTEPQFLVIPAISAVATLIAVLNSLFTKVYKDPLQKMVLMINLADFLYCTARLSTGLAPPHSLLHCRSVLAVYVFGYQSGIVWGAMFGHGLYTYIKTRKVEQLSSNLKYYMLSATLLPMLISLTISTIANFLNYDTGLDKCVHLVQPGQKDFETIFFIFVPLALTFLLNVVFYSGAIKQLRQMMKRENQKGIFILAVYPAILILCFGPFVIGFFLKFFGIDIPSDTMTFIFSCTQLQGLFDAIVYGGGITNVCRKFSQMICCCFKMDTRGEIVSMDKETEFIRADPTSVNYTQDFGSFHDYKDSLLRSS